MNNHKKTVGILDSYLITRESPRGVSHSTSDIVELLADKYEVYYLPKLEVLYSRKLVNLDIVEDNIARMEQMGIHLSSGFKSILREISERNISIRRAEKILISRYEEEVDQLKLVVDLSYAPSMRIFPFSTGEIFKLARKSSVEAIGITLRGLSDINVKNNLPIIWLTLSNELKYFFHRALLIHMMWVLIEPYHNLVVMRRIRKNKKLRFIGLIN